MIYQQKNSISIHSEARPLTELFRCLNCLKRRLCFRFHKPLRQTLERIHGQGSTASEPRPRLRSLTASSSIVFH